MSRPKNSKTGAIASLDYSAEALATLQRRSAADALKPDGVVSCPRKGQTGNMIAWAKCIQMHDEFAESCDAHACRLVAISRASITSRRAAGGDTAARHWSNEKKLPDVEPEDFEANRIDEAARVDYSIV